MKKLDAFTLIELLAAMLVGSVVIGFAYSGYEIIVKQFGSYKAINEKIAQASEFESILQRDISKGKEVRRVGDDRIEIGMSNHTIAYVFAEKYVLRKRGAAGDTFFVHTDSLKMQFLGNKQEVTDGLIDELSFSMGERDNQTWYHLLKEYGSDVFLENETKNINQ